MRIFALICLFAVSLSVNFLKETEEFNEFEIPILPPDTFGVPLRVLATGDKEVCSSTNTTTKQNQTWTNKTAGKNILFN
ncbi:MAG: hypothetical protein MJ252_09730 [archaeon]|nr:hypothetical protein [archaeon]